MIILNRLLNVHFTWETPTFFTKRTSGTSVVCPKRTALSPYLAPRNGVLKFAKGKEMTKIGESRKKN